MADDAFLVFCLLFILFIVVFYVFFYFVISSFHPTINFMQFNQFLNMYTYSGVNQARRQPAGQEQSGLSTSLRDTSTLAGAGDRTSNHTVTIQPALPPELS